MRVFLILIVLIPHLLSCGKQSTMQEAQKNLRFNSKTDILLLHYDCKTDVDDLHSVAAFASLIRTPQFSKLNYHAVAGTYGTQEGKYVPPNPLFELSFKNNWSDAHADFEKALDEVYKKAIKVLKDGGDVWIADAGQSDFSAGLIAKVQKNVSKISANNKIHIVQHSNWNEDVTGAKNLSFVKANSDYNKIPDGNALNNGTPGFNSADKVEWERILKKKVVIEIWKLAINLADTYNGEEGRYLNKSIKAGGLDFSDFCEVHWILELQGINDCTDYFRFLQDRD